MSDELSAEEKTRVETLVYTAVPEHILRKNAAAWSVRMLEHAFTRVDGYTSMEGARAALEYLLPLARHREEVARSHALMESLRTELVTTQRKIEEGAHIKDEAVRALEAEAVASTRHAENVRLTRRAIRWAIWATLVGVLGVLLPLLAALLARG